jgi:hypothetical protein
MMIITFLSNLKTQIEEIDMEKNRRNKLGIAYVQDLCVREGISFQECLSSQGFFSRFISNDVMWSENKEVMQLDTLKDYLSIKEWFCIARGAYVESSLYEVALRKIEVAIYRDSMPLVKNPRRFRTMSVLDMYGCGLSISELLDLYDRLIDMERMNCCDRYGWKSRGEFWRDSPTTDVSCIIANTLRYIGFDDEIKKIF